MSVNTFINWWFGWASHMKIDFRQACIGCDNKIPLLACDGTKIGIGFKNAFVEPIESSFDSPVCPTRLRRLDRCFIINKKEQDPQYYRRMRLHLFNICQDILGEVSKKSETSPAEWNSLTMELRKCLPSPTLPLFNRLLLNSMSDHERKCVSSLFKQLSYDSSVDTLIPYCATDELIQFALDCQSGKCSSSYVTDFSNRQQCFNLEVTDVLISSAQNSSNGIPSDDILDLLLYLAFVKSYHGLDYPAESPIPIEGKYNPEKYGRAFYFTTHGMQVRKMRKFSMDVGKEKKSSTNNYDDTPKETCNKIFPQVSKSGMTFVFFWFCPLHGHCYGFSCYSGQ